MIHAEDVRDSAIADRDGAETTRDTAQVDRNVKLTGRNNAQTALTNAEDMRTMASQQRDQKQAELNIAQENVSKAETNLSEAMDARRYTSLNDDTFTVHNPDSSNKTFQIGADNDINNQISFSMVNATSAGLAIDGTNLLNIDNARNSITSLDFSIDLTNSERSRLGSLQNKLQFTVSNLANTTQNIEASRSQIEDVDFAAEATELTKNQILAQSATAMLAQANAISQNILSLLAA